MIIKREVFTIICDNCERDLLENDEHDGYGDEIEFIASESGWFIYGNKHICPECDEISK